MKVTIALMTLLVSSLAQALSVGSYNIRNFDYDTRYRITTNKPILAQIIKQANADILTVMEITNLKEFENFVAKELPGHAVKLSECGGRGKHHLGFIYNTKTVELLTMNEDLELTDPGGNVGCDTSGRPLAIGLFRDLKTNKKIYGLGAHLKAGSKKDAIEKRHIQIDMVGQWINHLKKSTGVQDYFVAGDFNTTLYYDAGTDFHALNRFSTATGMVNTTQELVCSAYWWGGSDDNIEDPSLIDHVFVSGSLLKSGYKSKVGAHCQTGQCRSQHKSNLGVSYNQVSDHCPIVTTF